MKDGGGEKEGGHACGIRNSPGQDNLDPCVRQGMCVPRPVCAKACVRQGMHTHTHTLMCAHVHTHTHTYTHTYRVFGTHKHAHKHGPGNPTRGAQPLPTYQVRLVTRSVDGHARVARFHDGTQHALVQDIISGQHEHLRMSHAPMPRAHCCACLSGVICTRTTAQACLAQWGHAHHCAPLQSTRTTPHLCNARAALRKPVLGHMICVRGHCGCRRRHTALDTSGGPAALLRPACGVPNPPAASAPPIPPSLVDNGANNGACLSATQT